MNENLADEIRKTIESIKDMKIQASGINDYLSILEGMLRTDIQKKVDEAYQRGLEEGKKATWGLVADASSSEYQRGLDAAWDAAKKVAFNSDDGGLDIEELDKIFGCYSIQGVFKAYSAQQTIEKLKAYEEKQKADDEIKVGDVVMIKCSDKHTLVVTKVNDKSVWGVDADGSWNYWAKDDVIKIGMHFDIPKILEEMKE